VNDPTGRAQVQRELASVIEKLGSSGAGTRAARCIATTLGLA